MARTTTEIFNQIAQEKASMTSLNELLVNPNNPNSILDNSQTLLASLVSTSKVAIWRLYMWLMAFAIHIHEVLWDLFKAEVQQIVDAAQPGTLPWYQKIALEFQYGYDLVWDGTKYIYPVIDQSSKIITRCSVVDPGGIIRVKVARGEDPIPLNLAQQNAFTAYMNQMKFAGSNLLVVNIPSDKLKLQMEVFYDALFEENGLKILIINSIQNYLKLLPFNGVFRVNKLKDAIRSVDGVVDVDINHCQLNSITTLVFNEVEIEYQTLSGYIKIETTTPLDGFYNPPTNTIQVIKMTPYV